MTFRHGARVSEAATSVTTPTVASSTLQVYVGTAPVNLATNAENVNKAILAYSHAEAVAALGYVEDFENYTLCEAIDTAFNLYGTAPVVFINVLDPSIHKKKKSEVGAIENKKVTISQQGILKETVTVKLEESQSQALQLNRDYLLSFDKTGNLVIAVLASDQVPNEQPSLFIEYEHLDATMITLLDIIGGFDPETGDTTGIELINSIFPRFGLVPAQLIVPKFSKNPVVEAVMKTKVRAINTFFRAEALTDVDTTVANVYTKVPEWKNNNNYTSEHEIVCWPMVSLGEKKYHLSTHYAAAIARTAGENGDKPHVSPSNKSLNINGVCLQDGKEVSLGPDQAEYLNSQGINTALNFIGGHRAWGNQTGAFPANTDVKDAFIPNRLVHNWIANSIVLTAWSDIDDATNRSLIDGVVAKFNIWLNGLSNDGVLLGGRIEFRSEDNPAENLLAGKIKFRVFIAAPTPAQDMEFVLEVDIKYYQNLAS